MDNFQEMCGWIGCGLNILYHLAPVFPFLRVIQGKVNFEDTPGIFVSTCYVNSFIWYIYGDMIFSNQIKYSFCCTSCISLCLMSIYLICELKKYLVDSILNILILVTGTWAVYRALTIIIDDDRIVGKICICTSIIVYLTPAQMLYRVIKEKNYMFIPIYPAIIYCFACCSLITYGILISDYYIIISHSIGILVSLAQICIYFSYKRKYPAIGEREFSSTIGIETTGNESSVKEETSIKIDEESQVNKEKPVKIVQSES